MTGVQTCALPIYCDATLPRHGLDSGPEGQFQVIGRQGTKSGSERGAAGIRKLVGVQLHGELQFLRLAKDLLGLGDIESDALAEGVHRVDEAFLRRGGKHLPDRKSTRLNSRYLPL